MPRSTMSDLTAFLAIARERSFTRAAAQLGVSPSALSQTMRALEASLGVRLLTRTTRSVSPTEAGDRLIAKVGPRFEEIKAELDALATFSDEPSGTIRITAPDHAAQTILWPSLANYLSKFPKVHVEVVVDNTLIDIVAGRFDAGIRLGESIARDMVAVRVGPEMEMAVVAVPDYFAARGVPKVPQDLARHSCINFRLSTLGDIYAWEFEKDRHSVNVRVEGPLTINCTTAIRKAALAGMGVAVLTEDYVRDDIASGALRRVLSDWTPAFPGYYLYYPSRCQQSPAFAALIDALRFRAA